MLNNSEYMDAISKTYDDFAQLRRRVITSTVNELIEKKNFPDLKVKEEKGDSGNKVMALLVLNSNHFNHRKRAFRVIEYALCIKRGSIHQVYVAFHQRLNR